MTDQNDCVSKFFKQENNISSGPSSIPGQSPASSADLSQTSISTETDSLNLSQLDLEDKDPLCIRPYYNITPRDMPLSPHYILEEEFAANPWAILIATIFLTKTSAKTARPFMKIFFAEYPTPYHVLNDNPISLEKFFVTLGLRKRGHMIWKLSYQFVSSKWRRASDLCGIGKYGEDAYRIFCLGHTDLDPSDRYLKLYIDWLQGCTEFLKEHGVVDSESLIEDPVVHYYNVNLRE